MISDRKYHDKNVEKYLIYFFLKLILVSLLRFCLLYYQIYKSPDPSTCVYAIVRFLAFT